MSRSWRITGRRAPTPPRRWASSPLHSASTRTSPLASPARGRATGATVAIVRAPSSRCRTPTSGSWFRPTPSGSRTRARPKPAAASTVRSGTTCPAEETTSAPPHGRSIHGSGWRVPSPQRSSSPGPATPPGRSPTRRSVGRWTICGSSVRRRGIPTGSTGPARTSACTWSTRPTERPSRVHGRRGRPDDRLLRLDSRAWRRLSPRRRGPSELTPLA